MTTTQPSEQPFEVTTVAELGEGCIKMESGWWIGVPDDLTPTVGDEVKLWGKGTGYAIRGLSVGGVIVRYCTEEEQAVEDLIASVREDETRKARFLEVEADLDEQYNNLPEPFRLRLDRFRNGNRGFRWRFEAYEMSCCVDAVKIAEAAATRRDPLAWIEDFRAMPWSEQSAAVPNLYDGHSGNSFGCAVMLARLWIESPAEVVNAHGALTPLVGCDEYGCTHG